MNSTRNYKPSMVILMLAVFVCVVVARGQGSFMDGRLAVTQRGGQPEAEDGSNPYHTTQDPERDLPLFTTAPPFISLGHHPPYKPFLPYNPRRQSHDQYFQDSGGVAHHPTMPSAPAHHLQDPSTQLVPHKDTPSFSDVTTSRPTTLAPSSAALMQPHISSIQNEPSAETQKESSKEPPVFMTTGSLINDAQTSNEIHLDGGGITVSSKNGPKHANNKEKASKIKMEHYAPRSDVAATASSADLDDETTTSTIITTTVITTMQTPALCSSNFTAPGGYIETPQPAKSWYNTNVDCTYTVTIYMGYGVEIQVMNVSLAEGDVVRFEDLGSWEPSVLANESILLKGLVVRSWSNQISIHYRSRQPQSSSLLLRYQAFVLSCNFPDRPAYGDVSVTSLHAGGEAYFYCFNGYKLQGPSTLTCRNATTPYWSGNVPRCLVACGGMMKNATLGRIVSPGFPGNYSNNLTCHWVLEAPEGQWLHVHFEKVALAEDDDRFLIKNGNHIDSPILYDSYEVEYLPNEGIVSSSRHFFVEFTTDSFGTNTGVAIRYEAFAAGHCYEPFVKYGNFTTTDSTYAVGTVVEFTCDPGYTLEQGSVIIECMDPSNPQWNETEPACRAVCSGEITDSAGVVLSPNWPEAYDKGQDCIWGIHVEEDKRMMLDIQVLHMGKNDVLTFYDGDDLTAKILGQYSASRPHFKLYTSMADVTIQFQSDPATNIYGYNNGFVVHFFEVPRNDTCPELPEISNGWKTTSHPDLVHGTVVTYQCYPGFEVVGTELLMCQWDLTWSGDLPSCERVLSCADPGTVEHSRRVMSGPRLIVGSTVQYICNKGYSLSGNSLLSCYHRDSTGPKWSEKLPKCIPDTLELCRNPGTPAYSIQSSEKHVYQAGETLRFSCLSGYELQGEPVLSCIPGHPSKWSHSPPLCKAITSLPAVTLEYIDERRLDVASADFSVEGASVAVSIFIPVAIIMIIIMSIYFYFSRVQGKSLRLSMSTSPKYDHIRGEPAFETPIYETARPMIQTSHQRYSLGFCCKERACKES
ncbi:seizure protein 6 homolog isoform X2 [Myxocyprinus asiaticus]|uniref:seizure protein 6 homolog isoform X2 n=1 Tax=Myxocyprinus asiaticus TaxID=70543 RepID=UPI00222323BE|nr:seizure protein 6 homolog isoform X2 [Myxocyprinus asiaticus]XP_051535424.1 seizure protein 6 homolog isoform X2 [Myxocyprinus asiaticus]